MKGKKGDGGVLLLLVIVVVIYVLVVLYKSHLELSESAEKLCKGFDEYDYDISEENYVVCYNERINSSGLYEKYNVTHKLTGSS